MSSCLVQVQEEEEEEEEEGLLRSPLEQNMLSTEQDGHNYPQLRRKDECVRPLFCAPTPQKPQPLPLRHQQRTR